MQIDDKSGGAPGNITMSQRVTETNVGKPDPVKQFPDCNDGSTWPYGAIIPTGTPWKDNDSPGVELTGDTSMQGNWSFMDFWFYKPNGGIWVSLGSTTWQIHGYTSTSNGGKTWAPASQVSLPTTGFAASTGWPPVWSCYQPG